MTDQADRKPIRVLLLEDVSSDAELTMRELKRAGLRTQARVTSSEAGFRDEITQFKPDVILSDFSMPGFDGMLALDLARGLCPDIPFIFVSGTIGEEYAIRALNSGAVDYVLKNNLIRLPAAVERALQDARERGRLRQVERALRLSEERYRATFEQAAVGIVHTSPGGEVQIVNPKICEMSGYARDELVQRDFQQLVHAEDAPQCLDARARMLAGDAKPYASELRLLHKSREPAWVSVTTSLVRADDGKPSHFISVLHDISERKRAEEGLRRFRLALDNSADVIVIVDRSTMRYVDVNQAACRLLGYTREELLNLGPQDTLPLSRSALERAYDELIAAPGQRDELLSFYRCKDGSQMPFESTRQVLRSGDTWLVAVIARDIRERVASELALRASEERHRAMFERAAVGISHTDLDGRVLMVNPKMCEMSGFTREEVLARTFRDLTHPDDLQDSMEFRKLLVQGGSAPREREVRVLRKDGSYIWVNLTTSLVRAADGQPSYFISVLHDISERKNAEFDLQRFRMAMDVSADSIYLTDLETMRFIYVNDAACRRLEYTRERLLQLGPLDVLPGDPEQIRREYDEVVLAGQKGVVQERPFTRKDGSQGWTELHRRMLHAGGGMLMVTIGRDITDRKQADERIRRLNRVYAMFSGINATIVRVHDRDELFREVSRVAVEAGGFRMAWLGLVDRQAMRINPIAWRGAGPEYILKMPLELQDTGPEGRGLAGRAVVERKAVAIDDMTKDPRIQLKQEAGERGFRSLVMLPLIVADEAVGVLALYASESGFFDEEEMKLLRELAGDIAFALDHIEKQEKLDYLAYYDQLTGLASRALFMERAAQATGAARAADGKLAVAILDIERLRAVNESLGRQEGDALIKAVADRLTAAGGAGRVGRISADHFALLLGTVKGRSQAGRLVADALRQCFAAPFTLADEELRISAKAGIALFPGDGVEAEVLLRNAEAALRKGKESGEQITFHAPEMTARLAESLSLENQLRQALEKNEFVLHYQPKVDLETRRVVGTEALIRWNSPERGLVPPGQFIPLLEETGLILPVGAWALQRAVLDHGLWLKAGVQAPRIAVNVSAIQLRQRDFVDVVKAAVERGANPTAIDVEITESLLMDDVAGNIAKLKALRELGMKISIDDFGTGYSSLGYLAKLPVHTLKIDRSFIVTMLNDPATMTLVQTIISLAHSLRLNVVAEGVEREEQAKMLRLLRCDQIQGYLISRPVPMAELTPMLREQA